MKRLFLISVTTFIMGLFHLPLLAQRTCGSILNVDSIGKYDPLHFQRILEIEEHLERYLETLGEETGVTNS